MFPSASALFGTDRLSRISTLLLCLLCGIGFAIGTSGIVAQQEQRPLLHERVADEQPQTAKPNNATFPAFLDALDVLQGHYFAIWQGIWPTSIDWTSAVIGTYVSAALTTISTSSSSLESDKDSENLVNKYFSQLVGSYFGQDAFALRQEAYDDMLWVVLGWLESIKFINTHSALHYESTYGKSWYGKQYIPAFAHRARLFWDMASQGWDTTLCDGGMIWSPYLVPYKNAITNELYIAASISMYLHFPGDQNTSPFGLSSPPSTTSIPPAQPHDPKYLAAAIEAYKWLNSSNMTDDKGLYVDGFHVSGWSKDVPKNKTGNLKCDERNEMVYTYNQGVLLSGQRGLYEATGAKSYLKDGHNLVADVITATGWDLTLNRALDPSFNGSLGKWYGLGRRGILEEVCDAEGYCSQNGQTFKGIFFHHLTLFCARLPEQLFISPGTLPRIDFEDDKNWHDESCRLYGEWIQHNANAAITTQNDEGEFGMWWGSPSGSSVNNLRTDVVAPEIVISENAVDYRNSRSPPQWGVSSKIHEGQDERSIDQARGEITVKDLNDRGRGRTVETQGGGVSVLRAAWELVVRGDA